MANQFAGRFFEALFDTSSKLLKNVSFDVYTDALTTTLATLYTDRTKTTVVTTATATDSSGMAEFFVVPGLYYIKIGIIVQSVTVYEDVDDTADVASLNAVAQSVGDETTARINADGTNLQTAKDYADSASTNAQVAAQGYADNAVNTVSADLATLDGQVLKKTGTQTATGATNFTGGLQVDSQPVATESYADSVAQGLKPLDAVRLATTTALPANTRSGNVLTATSNGALALVDGVTPDLDDPILVKDEATGANNGIYTVTATGNGSTPYQLTRRSDFDQNTEVVSGSRVIIDEGDTHAGSSWFLDTANPITVNTTALVFKRFSAATEVIAGDHLNRDGNILNVLTGPGELADQDYVDSSVALLAPKWTITDVLETDHTASPYEVACFGITGIRTCTLPTNPPNGSPVIARISGTLQTDKYINVACGAGAHFTTATGATTMRLDNDNQVVMYVYRSSDNTWSITSGWLNVSTLQAMMDTRDVTTLGLAQTFAIGQAKKIVAQDGTEYFVTLTTDGRVILDSNKYDRPDFSTYNTYQFTDKTHYSKNGGTSTSFSGTLTLTSGEDALILFPTSVAMGRAGGFVIAGGRNVAILGGEVNVDSTVFPNPQSPGNPPTSDYRGIYFNNQTGDIWLEGMWIHGTRLGDAFDITHANTNPCTITMQNCLIGNTDAGGGPSGNSIAHVYGSPNVEPVTGYTYDTSQELHPDCMQFFSTSSPNLLVVKLRVFNSIWRTGYQGMLLNQALESAEFENFVVDQQSTTFWNGEQKPGYAVALFSGSSAYTMPVTFGNGCIAYQWSGSNHTHELYPEDSPHAAELPVTKSAYVAPSWQRTDYGRSYVAPGRLELLADSGTVARIVEAGSILSTARPAVLGKVIWTASGTPTNAINGDIIVSTP